MSIVRGPKHQDQFVQIFNAVARDNRLSLKARGLLVELLSYPENWRINADQIAASHKEGRTAIRTALQELEDYGYLTRTRVKDDKGRWTWDSILREVPVGTEEIQGKPEDTSTDPSIVRFSDGGKPDVYKRRYIKNEELVGVPSQLGTDSVQLSEQGQEALKEEKAAPPRNTFIQARNITDEVWKPLMRGASTQSPGTVANTIKTALDNGYTVEAVSTAVQTLVQAKETIVAWKLQDTLNGKQLTSRRGTSKGFSKLAADVKHSADEYRMPL